MKVYFSNNTEQYLYTRVSENKSNLKAFHPHCTLSVIKSKFIMYLVYIFNVSTEYSMLLFMHPYVMKGGVWLSRYLSAQ